MTPRPHAWTRRAALAISLAAASLLSLPGCNPMTIFYFLQPFEPTIPAPGPSLKGKKIVVLVHVDPGAGADFSDLTRDLTREFVSALRKNVKKITLLVPDQVPQARRHRTLLAIRRTRPRRRHPGREVQPEPVTY